MICGNYTPDFMVNATNVYRTKEYIVKQQIIIVSSLDKDSYLLSEDTYYARTPLRDFQYNCVFTNRKRKNGKRLPSNTYARKYIDW